MSALSIILSLITHQNSTDNANTLERDRVETDHILSNTNSFDYSNPWEPWEEPITPHTTYIGVQRKVFFNRPFWTAPRVSTSFSLIDVKPTEKLLSDIGYHPKIEDDPGLSDLHVLTVADGITEKYFTLKIGIGIRTTPGLFLANQLENTPVNDEFVAQMMRYRQLSDRPNLKLSHDEVWMVNFYRDVGTLDASWIAQGRQK